MDTDNAQDATRGTEQAGEQGYMLLGLIVAIAIILIGLSVAAAKVAFSLRREREAESARRADQYVRAIRKFYLKNHTYPASIDQLKNTNMVRYLRQEYVDPLTGKADYRLIAVGQNQTTVKGFFGEPLGGLATTGLGSVAGMQSPGIPGPGSTGGGFGASAPGTPGAGTTAGGYGTTPGNAGTGGAFGSGGTAGTSGSGGPGSQPGTGLPGSGSTGPFMGVGSNATGPSILEINGQTTYETWEFLYDPRIEKLKAAAALNAGASSANGSTLGTPASSFGTPGSNQPNPLNNGGATPGGPGGGTPPPQQ
jgi:type II secretory pathway pseudopilin PulG